MTGRITQSRIPERPVAIAAGFLALAVILGGGGTPNPVTEVWLELLAVLAGLAWLWSARAGQPLWPRDPLLWLAGGIAVLLPLAQLVPLPPQIWTALPGRADQLAALQLVEAGDTWQPLSTSPMRTLASLLSLGPPLLVLAMTGTLDARQRRWLIATVAAMALLSAVFGALQLAGGTNAVRLYAASSQMVVTGFQANRNAEADLLLIGVLALAALRVALPGKWEKTGGKQRDRWFVAAGLVLVLASVLTASRMGIALLPIVLLAVTLIAAQDSARRRLVSLGKAAAGALVVIAGGLILFQSNTRLQEVAARFGLTSDGREALWADSLYVIAQYWPFGSGMGTFVPTFIAAEPLESVDPSIPNRAHNDFLELLIEAGLPGIVALLAVAAMIVFMALRAWRRRPEDRAQVLFGIAALLIIGLHSLVDYPLRSMALACFAALAAGMLATPPRSQIAHSA